MEGNFSDTIQVFIDNLMEKQNKEIEFENRVNSYGAAQLFDGSIVHIRNNFYYLQEAWQIFMIAKAFDVKSDLDDLLARTNGGIFDCGDMIFRLEDVRVLYKSQLYANNSEEEKENTLWKTTLINKHLDETIYNELNDEDEDYEDD